jgi:arsenate reductase (thioredoxin)
VSDLNFDGPMPPRQKSRVLFICIGNSCRSQMAEAFARMYGSDVLIAASAGLSPAFAVAPDTMRAMAEKNLDLRDHFPKSIRQLGRSQFDIAVNISGAPLPSELAPSILQWDVADPISMNYEEHCEVRDVLERLVMNLVLDLRRQQQETRLKGQGSGRLPL